MKRGAPVTRKERRAGALSLPSPCLWNGSATPQDKQQHQDQQKQSQAPRPDKEPAPAGGAHHHTASEGTRRDQAGEEQKDRSACCSRTVEGVYAESFHLNLTSACGEQAVRYAGQLVPAKPCPLDRRQSPDLVLSTGGEAAVEKPAVFRHSYNFQENDLALHARYRHTLQSQVQCQRGVLLVVMRDRAPQ